MEKLFVMHLKPILTESNALDHSTYDLEEKKRLSQFGIQPHPHAEHEKTTHQELESATMAIGADQHKSLGVLDGVKSLFLWLDTPEERLRKDNPHKAPQIDLSEPGL